MAKLELPFALAFSSFLLFVTVVSSSSFFPIDHYLINCGSHGSTVDLDHRRFDGDSSSNSPLLSLSQSVSLADSDPRPGSSPIYHTGRVFNRPSKYAFSIRDPGAHLVRLHFQVLNSGLDYSDAQFYVLANEYVLLNSSSIETIWNSAVIKEYAIRVDSDKLVITFVPSEKSKFAFVNGIEVISAPKDLIADSAQYLNSHKSERIDGLSMNALETVYRVTVGGPKVTPFNDTLWRTWLPDDEFLVNQPGSSSKIYYGGHIQYQTGGASREVGPDNMYNTARIIKSSSDSIPKDNISWAFPVEEGYKYLVRTHFCDISSLSSGLLYFNVYVNGFLAYENIDLTKITNGILASPFYADFVVDGGEGDSGVLTVNVGPSDMSVAHAVDATLNGVEIMKMNNSMGSFGGEVCAGYVLKRWGRRNGDGVALPLLAGAVFLLLIGSVAMKRSFRLGDSFVWSRLPMEVPDGISKLSSIQVSSNKV